MKTPRPVKPIKTILYDTLKCKQVEVLALDLSRPSLAAMVEAGAKAGAKAVAPLVMMPFYDVDFAHAVIARAVLGSLHPSLRKALKVANK